MGVMPAPPPVVPASTAAASSTRSTDRLLYIDNLRWLMIVLVVAMHAAVTYSGLGSWYYIERTTLRPFTALFFVLFQTHLQAFFMGLLFLIAGYFVPSSYDRKGAVRFLWDRAFRLGVPTLVYALLIHPFNVNLIRAPTAARPAALVLHDYARYVFTFGFLSGTGPLWFAAALLLFSVAYTGVSIFTDRRGRRSRPLPSHVAVLGLIVAMALGSFAVRLVQPIGTSVLNMQLCFFTQYVLLFAVGCAARRNDWLTRLSSRFAMKWLIAAVTVGPVLWFAMILTGGAASGRFDAYAGGLHWQNAAYSAWESFFCVGVSLGLLATFRDRFNRQGRTARFLSANAFAVYVFHAPVLIALALALRPVHAGAMVKFLLLTATGAACTFLLAQVLIRQIPGLRRAMA
jgi:fucose 4-O-acetylase-like acetyltransferase